MPSASHTRISLPSFPWMKKRQRCPLEKKTPHAMISKKKLLEDKREMITFPQLSHLLLLSGLSVLYRIAKSQDCECTGRAKNVEIAKDLLCGAKETFELCSVSRENMTVMMRSVSPNWNIMPLSRMWRLMHCLCNLDRLLGIETRKQAKQKTTLSIRMQFGGRETRASVAPIVGCG